MEVKVKDNNVKVEIKYGDIIVYKNATYIVLKIAMSNKLTLRDLNGYHFYGDGFNDISEVITDDKYTHYPQSEYRLELVKI